MTNAAKKALAQKLWVAGGVTTKSELAETVGVRNATITKWCKEGGWDLVKKSILVTRQEELGNLMDQLSEINAVIKGKPEGSRYADSSQADIQSKITASIRKLTIELSVGEIIEVMIGFNEYIAKADIDHAQLITQYQDAYIKSKI